MDPSTFGLIDSLVSLDLTANPLGPILPRITGPEPEPTPLFEGLRSLILLVTPIRDLVSLANLSARLPNLTALILIPKPASVDGDQTKPAIMGDTLRLSGDVDDDHGVLIALFPRLQVLNGTDIRGKQRDEAERRFVNTVSLGNVEGEGDTALRRLYDDLAKKHDLQPSQEKPSAAIQPSSLRSKMISKST
jgi:hypothetical protein